MAQIYGVKVVGWGQKRIQVIHNISSCLVKLDFHVQLNNCGSYA